ncbi:MAG TPA: agmatinase [Bacteroidales bacterium]|nr:agmatinase [Bacteroidales bacterium]
MHFGGYEIESSYENSSIVILPVPYDETSTYMKGADKGPDAIIEASPNLEYFDIETRSDIRHHGICTTDPVEEKSSPEAMADAVEKATASILADNKFPVIIGGNHSVSIGSFRAVARKFKNLTILQLDAHSDLRVVYENSPLNHACAMARAREVAEIVQVGIRSMAGEELINADFNRIFPAHEIFYDKKLYSKALELLNTDVYITIDLDVFDPSIMPSTGTPEPGGPDYTELMHFLRRVAEERNVVGFDVVELCPNPDNKMPDFVAAKVVYQLLSYIFSKR